MGVYPKKKVMSGRFGFNTEKIQEGIESGGLDAVAGITTAVGAGISNIGKKDLGYGVSHQGVGAATYGTGLQMAGTLGAAGAKFGGPMGALIGAGVGMAAGTITGFVKAKSEKKNAESLFTQNLSGAVNTSAKESKTKYAGLGRFKARSYESGGKIDPNGKAVIMGGKLHKDGGNDIILADSREKIAETEREELLLTFEQTNDIESLIEQFDSKKNDALLVKLGKRFQEILMNETIDNSGIYAF